MYTKLNTDVVLIGCLSRVAQATELEQFQTFAGAAHLCGLDFIYCCIDRSII